MTTVSTGTSTAHSSATGARRGASIRVKLFGLISSLLIGLAGFFVLYFPARQIDHLERALEQKALSYSRLIAFQVRSSVAFNDKETARDAFEGASQDRDIAFMALFDESGQALQAQGRGDSSKSPAFVEKPLVLDREDAVRVVAPVVSLEGPKGVLVVELSKESILAEAATVRQTALLIGLLALALGVAAAWIVGSSFGRRLQTIARNASTVAGGNLGAPPLSAENRDEIGQLAEAFNAMLKSLQRLVGQIAEAAVRLHGAAQGFTAVADRQQQGAARQSGAVDQGRSTVEALAESAQKLVTASREIGQSAELALSTMKASLPRGSAELEQLSRFLTKTGASVAEIERISEDAQSATEESLFVMQAVADVADETVQSSKEVVRSAEDLLRLSQSLEQLIGGFVLHASNDKDHAGPASEPRLAVAAE